MRDIHVGSCHAMAVRAAGCYVAPASADTGLMVFYAAGSRSGLEDGNDLSFGDHVVEANKDQFELARGGRSHRDFHLHGFDKHNVVAVANGSSGLDRKRANAPRHLGHNLDLWHSAPLATVCRAKAPANGFLLWRQIA
jgi:hypothetical protein